MSMISQFQHLWKMFLRPTRQEYSKGDLGHEISVFGKYKSKRTDCVILNKKQQKLQCSLFEPISLENDNNLQGKFPCVIYCHCNSGSRLEALRLLPQIISSGMGLFCFDFSGSGLSEGEYVTLGINESHDLECVVNHLVNQGKVSNIALWGRSMGAVTCILYMGMKTCNNAVKAIVFDSGFSNMNQLTLDLAKQKTGMPNILIEPALYLVNDQVRERVDVDIKSIDLAKTIHSVFVPIHFVCSKEDTFVKCDHSERLYDRYNGLKWIEHTTGGHNAHRSNELIDMLVDWISYFVFDRKKPAFYQYIPKSTEQGQSKEDGDIYQENGDQNHQNSKKSRVLNSATINRGFSPTQEAFKERMQILNENNAKSKSQQSLLNKDIPVSPIKSVFQLGKQSTASGDTCSPPVKNQKQAASIRFSQEMQTSIGQNSTIVPKNNAKDFQYNQQYLDQYASLEQQRGRNAKVIPEEKESSQVQSQDSVSSQTRLGTEETNSRNENTDNQINGISNILSSRNASHNRSSNHNGFTSNNGNNNNNNNQHTNSFLSSNNEELNSNERPQQTYTPQRGNNQISIQNCEFEDSPQIGKKIKNNSRSLIESTPSKSCETYQRLSSNFTSFQVGGISNSNSISGLGTTVVPPLGNKGSFFQTSVTSIDGRKFEDSPQQKVILKGQGTPQFNRDNKSQYSFIGGGTPSSSGSIKSDYQDSPNLPHNFPNVYVKHDSPQNRQFSNNNLKNSLKLRNHRNLSQFSIPKSTQDQILEINQQNNSTDNINNNNINQPSQMIQENNYAANNLLQNTDSPIDRYQQSTSSNVVTRVPQQKSIYQLQVAQQLLTNHQPFKTPSQQAIGSFKQIQIEENPQTSSRQTRSSTCNVPVQFPAGSQGNQKETPAQIVPTNTSNNQITSDPAPYTPFFAQTASSNSRNNNNSSNPAPNQSSIRIRGLNTSIDFNMNQQPSQQVQQNTPKSLKIMSPSSKNNQNHLSYPSMPQVQAQNNLYQSSFANSSYNNYQNKNQFYPQTKEQQVPPVKVISLLAESQKKLSYPSQKPEQQPYSLGNSYEVSAMAAATTQSSTNPLSQSFDKQKQTPIVGINIFSPKTPSVTKTPEYVPYSTSSSNIPPNKQSPQTGITSPNPATTYQTYNKANQVYKSLSSIQEMLDQKSVLANSNKSNYVSAEFASSNQNLNKNINNNNSINNPSENNITPGSVTNQGNFFSMPAQFFNTYDNSRNYTAGNISFLQSGKYSQDTANNISGGFGFSKNKQ